MTRITDERLAEVVTDKDNFYRDEIKAMAAELQSLRAQGGVRVKRQTMRMDGSTLKAIHFMLDSADEDDDTPADALLWIGDLHGDDGQPVYGLHLANAEYPEEGGITLVELDRPALSSLEGSPDPVSEDMVERVMLWVRDDVLPAYGITHNSRASDPEMIEGCHAALAAKGGQ